MNYLIAQRQLSNQILCDSAGTSSYHIGSPPDSRMTAAARHLGIHLVGRARQLQSVDLEQFDFILAMDKENYADILALDPGGEYHSRVKLICDFCRHHDDREVPDPYYGGEAGFNYVIELLMDACEGLLDYVLEYRSAKI